MLESIISKSTAREKLEKMQLQQAHLFAKLWRLLWRVPNSQELDRVVQAFFEAFVNVKS